MSLNVCFWQDILFFFDGDFQICTNRVKTVDENYVLIAIHAAFLPAKYHFYRFFDLTPSKHKCYFLGLFPKNFGLKHSSLLFV